MKLIGVKLKNIKSFVGEHFFDFKESETINTVSGINGSGKSTIFKAIILAQKIFFAEEFNYQPLPLDYNKSIHNFFNGLQSFIELQFAIKSGETEVISSFKIRCIKYEKESISIVIDGAQDDRELIKNYWNINNPKNLIVYIDSNRNISEEDFSNENIQLSSEDNDLAIEYIFNPEKIFYSTYYRIIRDYVRERVIPSTPRTDLPHNVAKAFITDILDYIKIANFTGLVSKGQFILQIKSIKTNKNYDVRNLSSGEKTLFYIYHFICYVKNIGMLIIDEPENNLHENMLSNFVKSLNEICKRKDFADLVMDLAKKNKVSVTDADKIKSFYKHHNLSQVFLLTHSKNLVYNNFTMGKNYIIDNGMDIISYDDLEKKLREIGISEIINKILFVEGQTENDFLETIFSQHNIKVKSLGGSGEVIETFKKFLHIEPYSKDMQVCFLIDRDTKSQNEIDKIRNLNPLFFDEHFIIMNRHEIENYFLEPLMFKKIFETHSNIYPSIIVPTEETILSEMRVIADEHIDFVLRKKISDLNQKSLSDIKTSISKKSIPINNISEYETYIIDAFKQETIQSTIDKVKQNYQEIDLIKSKWDSNWIDLCDGKIVLSKYIGQVSSKLNMHSKRTKDELIKIGLESTNFEINSIVNKILSILN